MNKSEYFVRSLLHASSSTNCPYCGHPDTPVIDRKYLVTTLRECAHCQLMFRHPLDTKSFNRKFYQEDYEQHDGITTDLPSASELAAYTASNFANSGKNFHSKVQRIKSLVGASDLSVIDYGANWGYVSYQFQQAGFAVQAYEISKPRAKFGEKLGVDILTDERLLQGPVSVFFSSHVIEHLPDIKHMFELAQRLLSDEGYFVAYCPNGSAALKETNPKLFHRLWGQVHPNCLSAEFFAQVFRDVPFLIGSDHATENDSWDGNSQKILDVTGNELFVFAKIKNQRF